MTDYFALLNESRHPWIDEDLLKEKFLTLSSQVHPDRMHQASPTARKEADEGYAEINTAYNCLRETKHRLRHLLELETGRKPDEIQIIPSQLMDFAFEIGRVCKEADEILMEKTKAASAILKVQFFERSQQIADSLMALQRRIGEQRNTLLAELKMMNPVWDSDEKPRLLKRVEEIYRLLGYFARWTEQVHERIVELSL